MTVTPYYIEPKNELNIEVIDLIQTIQLNDDDYLEMINFDYSEANKLNFKHRTKEISHCKDHDLNVEYYIAVFKESYLDKKNSANRCDTKKIKICETLKEAQECTFTSWESVVKKTPSVYEIAQYDVWFSESSKVVFGLFSSFEDAVEQMKKGFEKLYPGFNDDVSENGSNQWISERLDFGVNIREIELNTFSEI